MVHGIDPSRVKAAVFDLGGVILSGGVEAVLAFGARHGLSPEAWSVLRQALFSNEGPWAALERGECTFDDFLFHMCEEISRAGLRISPEDARNFMGDGETETSAGRVRPDIVAAIARIRGRMPTALLTNNVAEWRPVWRSVIDVDALFDVVVDSSEVGTRKPEEKIYEITREQLGFDHADLFFVDDQGPNLKAARALGWQTLKYEDTGTVLQVLDALAAGNS